jgi:RNAse (barnase) inhibitor barstar
MDALAQQLSDTLVQQLNNRRLAGSYTLDCSVETLRCAADAAGLALIDIDLRGVKGKQNLLNALAGAAKFPAEFGANWDALADALCDLSWLEANGYVLLLRNASETLGLSANDREIAQDIFADTVVYWHQHNKPFWVFFS